MHDPRVLLDPATDAVRRFRRRGVVLDTARLSDLLAARASAARRGDDARAASKHLAAGDRDGARELRATSVAADAERGRRDAELTEYLLGLPNLPSDEVPDGASESDAVVVRTWGEREAALGHAEPTAAPERALVGFLLDRAAHHGYTEVTVPVLVTRAAVIASGHLPAYAHDLRTTGELYLLPSAQVALMSRLAGRTVDAARLPLASAAHGPRFGQAGQQGSSVDLLRVEESHARLDVLVGHVEAILRELGLAHRVLMPAAGDLDVAARTAYDVDVWLPDEGRYRRVATAADHGSFRARRAGIRTRTADGTRTFAATAAASVLVDRLLDAVLQQRRSPPYVPD